MLLHESVIKAFVLLTDNASRCTDATRVGQTNEKEVQEPMAKGNNLASLEPPEPNDAPTRQKCRYFSPNDLVFRLKDPRMQEG